MPWEKTAVTLPWVSFIPLKPWKKGYLEGVPEPDPKGTKPNHDYYSSY